MITQTLLKDKQAHQSEKLNTISNLSDMSMNDTFNYISNESISKINYYWLGRSDYYETWELQKKIQSQVINDNLKDVVLFLEHDPIYTIGRNADDTNLLPTKPVEMQVVKTDRGGDVTCHAPGQLIGYPIIDLKKYNKSITWFMRGLETSIIEMLKELKIDSETKEGLTGVWVDDNKIAALGVRLSKWVSMHGFAINVYTDLKLFSGIIPCGISNFGLTSVLKLKVKKYDLLQIAELMAVSLSRGLLNSIRAEHAKI